VPEVKADAETGRVELFTAKLAAELLFGDEKSDELSFAAIGRIRALY